VNRIDCILSELLGDIKEIEETRYQKINEVGKNALSA
jgi:hypothetical protein